MNGKRATGCMRVLGITFVAVMLIDVTIVEAAPAVLRLKGDDGFIVLGDGTGSAVSFTKSSGTTTVNVGGKLVASDFEVEGAGDTLSALVAMVDSMNTRLTTAEGKLATAESTIAEMNTTLTATQGDLDTAESELSDARSRLSTAEGTLTTAEATITELTTNLTATQGDLDTAESELLDARTRLATVESDVATAESTITELTTNMTATQADLSTAEGELLDARTRLMKVESNLTMAESAITQLTTNLTETQDDLGTEKLRIDDLVSPPAVVTYNAGHEEGFDLKTLYESIPTACTSDYVIQLPTLYIANGTVKFAGHPCDHRITIQGTPVDISSDAGERDSFVLSCETGISASGNCLEFYPKYPDKDQGYRGTLQGIKLRGFRINDGMRRLSTGYTRYATIGLAGAARITIHNVKVDHSDVTGHGGAHDDACLHLRDDSRVWIYGFIGIKCQTGISAWASGVFGLDITLEGLGDPSVSPHRPIWLEHMSVAAVNMVVSNFTEGAYVDSGARLSLRKGSLVAYDGTSNAAGALVAHGGSGVASTTSISGYNFGVIATGGSSTHVDFNDVTNIESGGYPALLQGNSCAGTFCSNESTSAYTSFGDQA